MILEKIDQLLEEVKNISATNADEIEALRLKYLSKKGAITALMNDFRNVPADQKKAVGIKINELKQTAQERINALKEQLETADTESEAIDLTRTPYPIRLGTRHPLTIVTNEIIDIFSRMGFVLADGPEVEDDLHVFTKMNFAADHPARDILRGAERDWRRDEKHPAALAHQFGASPRDGELSTAHPHHLPGTRVSQRGHHRPRPLLLPSGGGTVYRQERVVHRPQAGASVVCARDVRCRHQDTPSPELLPLHRAKCRDGHLMPHLRRQGLRILQAHGMGGNLGLRNGRSQRARAVRHRQQGI